MSLAPLHASFPVRDLQRNYRAIVNTAKRTRGAVALINNSKPEAVLLDVVTYNALVQDDFVYDEEKVLKLVEASRASHARGESTVLRSWDELDAE